MITQAIVDEKTTAEREMAAADKAPAEESRQKPLTPSDLIDGGVASKNTIYEAIKSGEIETFRLGNKIFITPAWRSKYLGW
jgi:hypothetical protein